MFWRQRSSSILYVVILDTHTKRNDIIFLTHLLFFRPPKSYFFFTVLCSCNCVLFLTCQVNRLRFISLKRHFLQARAPYFCEFLLGKKNVHFTAHHHHQHHHNLSCYLSSYVSPLLEKRNYFLRVLCDCSKKYWHYHGWWWWRWSW